MEKRVVVFLVLSLVIIFGYEYVLTELGLLPKSTVSAPSDQTPAEGSSPDTTDQGQEAHAPSPNAGVEGPPLQPSADDPKAHATPKELALAETVEVGTDLYRATFTTRGAALTSWELTR
ncbi:MAG: hypothetical protein OEV51_04615, partial [Nitrospira sp.]|nr:hypothetical protein [Nitrospira sp.]